MEWRGKGATLAKPVVFTTREGFTFGGKQIPPGATVKQFETRNFGFTVWTDKTGRLHIAKE